MIDVDLVMCINIPPKYIYLLDHPSIRPWILPGYLSMHFLPHALPYALPRRSNSETINYYVVSN